MPADPPLLAAYSRLFLSCDLTGSTQFKQAEHKRSNPWQKVFLSFYREFPQALVESQVDLETTHLEFSLWKPVGDELIFTCPVNSERDIANGVRTWLNALRRYKAESLAESSMGVKGGAFIGTFPGPDSESSIPRNPRDETSGRDVVELNMEALAANPRSEKYLYDYFGPGIDTGFRVLGKCTGRHFTLSLEVAFALSVAAGSKRQGEDYLARDDLVLLDSPILKGVWGERPYPLFAIDLDHGKPIREARIPFQGPAPTMEDIRNLCSACYESAGWPTKLHLPLAERVMFKDIPKDALHDYLAVSAEGFESATTEVRGGSALQSDAPLG